MSYELTPADERKLAVRLARSAIERACKDTVTARQLEELDGVPCATLSQEIYKRGLLMLTEIAATADFVSYDEQGQENLRRPDYPARLKALEILMTTRTKEAELLIEANERLAAKGGNGGRMVRARVLTEAQIAQMEQLNRDGAP